MIALLALLNPAVAQTEVCAEPYSRIQFGVAIGQVTDAFADLDLRDARDRLNDVGDRLPCLEDVVDRRLLAKFTRYMSMAYFFSQDTEGAKRWGLASRLADPELRWDDDDFPIGHPLRDLVDQAELPHYDEMEGQHLAPPKGGGVFLSGTLALEPDAHLEIPYLVQIFDRDQQLVEGWWQDGTVYPDGVVSPRSRGMVPPLWWTGDGPSSARGRAPIAPPGEGLPVAPLVGSGALLVASAVAYYFADGASKSLVDQTSAADLTAARTRTNLLVLASGVGVAGAVGLGIGGVIVHGNGITVRF